MIGTPSDCTFDVLDVVGQIHRSPTKAVVITTGGGTGIFPLLLRRGGGSATLLSGLIPWSENEALALLGGRPDKIASEQVARSFAMVAFQRAHQDSGQTSPVIGVGSTAVLQRTPTEREGRVHYIYAALQTETKTISETVIIKDPHDIFYISGIASKEIIRTYEEELNTDILLNLIAEGCGVVKPLHPYKHQLSSSVMDRKESTLVHPDLMNLWYGRISHLVWNCGTALEVDESPEAPKLLMPGSFNPFHIGHAEMMNVAEQHTGAPCHLEISVTNVEKPTLDYLSLEERLTACSCETTGRKVWVTNAPTFVEKARLFPNTVFVIGYDTAARIVDPKYYGNSIESRDEALLKLSRLGSIEIRFLIFPRKYNGVFASTLDETGFPLAFRRMSLMVVNDHMVNRDLSSTHIRNSGL